MADNVAVTEGSGKTIASDDVQVDGSHAQGQVQFVKLVSGELNATASIRVDIGAKANALRTAPASDISDATYIGDIRFGESLPAGDNNIGNVDIVTQPADTFVAEAGSLGKGVLLQGDDGTDRKNINVDPTTGDVQVDVTNTITETNSGAIKDALQIMDDWDDSDKCKVIIQTGSNAIGKLAANDGVDIGNVDVTSVIPLTGATNLGKARDAALGANDVGVMALAVRDDTLTTLTPVDGDYVPLRVSSTGQLHVTGGGGGTEYTEDVITANPQVGSAIMVERDDALTTVTPVEADWIGLRGTAEGALWVQDFNSDAIFVDITAIKTAVESLDNAVEIMDDWDATQGSAVSSDGIQLMGAYDSTKPSAVSDGQSARVLVDSYGRLLPGVEPEWFNAVFDSANATAEGQVVKAATASKKIYILSYVISSDVEGWVKLQDEDSNALTGKFWLKAGGGVAITLPPGAPLVLNVVNKALEVICEAAGDVSVTVTGYLAP